MKTLIVKVMELNDSHTSQYCTNEYLILNKLSSTMIVKAYDIFIQNNKGYTVLEYITGPTLEQLTKVTPERANKIFTNIVRALNYLHF